MFSTPFISHTLAVWGLLDQIDISYNIGETFIKQKYFIFEKKYFAKYILCLQNISHGSGVVLVVSIAGVQISVKSGG